MRTKAITIAEIEYAAFRLAEKFMNWNEPIPNFGTRFPNILESCIGQPFIQFGGKDLYRNLSGKASILFYLMIKNHPFQNGNKRIAVMTLLYFLYKNGRWLNVNSVSLYKFAVGIAESKSNLMAENIKNINAYITKHLITYPS